MRKHTLIIADALVEPPTDSTVFYNVTMFSHEEMNMHVLLHTTQDMKDLMYKWMKPRGLMDFVDAILNENEKENGIRIDNHHIVGYSYLILVKALRFENQLQLLGQLKSITNRR
jgi:hypothetical protein